MEQKPKAKKSASNVNHATTEHQSPSQKLTPIQEFEFLINTFLKHHPDMQAHELIGFMELKLIEFKETWRIQQAVRIASSMQQASNEGTH